MAPRLDPSCPDVRLLEARHDAHRRVMLDDGAEAGSRLAQVLRETRERDLARHARACPRCKAHPRPCVLCGAQSGDRHAWRCQASPTRWKDLLPWNWRRRAPAGSAPRTPPTSAAHPSRKTSTATPRGDARAPARPVVGPPPPPRQARRPHARSAQEVLGVPRGAGIEEIRLAFRRRALELHPDRTRGDAAARSLAERRMSELNAAYAELRRASRARGGRA